MKYFFAKITTWDAEILKRIFQLEHYILERTLPLISRSADGGLFPIVLAIGFFSLPMAEAISLFLCALLAFAIELPIYKGIKSLIKRNRPFEKHFWIEKRMIPPDRFSFPSGHTSAAFLMAQILTFFFPPIGLFLFPWAALVGMSRVYLGVHYPTDTVAGAFIGLFSAHIAFLIFGF